MKESDTIYVCFLLRVESNKYDYYNNVVTEKTLLLTLSGGFFIRIVKNAQYYIKAFDGNRNTSTYYKLDRINVNDDLFVVKDELPEGVSPFLFRLKPTPVSLLNQKIQLYELEPIDIPHFEEACRVHKFFFVGDGRDPRLNP